jgi:dihydrolipoamide dehydrogenase
MSQSFDVVVIGAGSSGYIAAVRAAQLGFRVACIEKWRNAAGQYALGGTCLNVGCIPSKALLASSEQYENASSHLGDHGISAQGVTIDVPKMIARKDAIVGKMTKGIEFLFRKNGITWLKGHARFLGCDGNSATLEITEDGQSQIVESRHVIVATGSRPRQLPGAPVDNIRILDNEGALSLKEVPRRLGVIGAGVIGLELGSVWRRLGAEVVLLEAAPTFLAATDSAVRKEAARVFARQGLQVNPGVTIGPIRSGEDGVSVAWTDSSGKEQVLDCDRLIVSVGRVPHTEGLGLDAIGLSTDERGFIPVDAQCRTALPNVWAIGDVVRGPMLAHKGEDEGVMVAELIAGQKPHLDYDTIPWVIYTHPEIAWVGKTQEQLEASGRAFKSGQFPFAINGRALGMGASEGFVKVLADAQTDEVLGVHIVAASASDLIAEAVVAMEFKASAEDIGRICHAHPSLSEVMREAALAASDKRALNM